MSNSLRSLRTFSAEIMKCAAKISDADIQAMVTDKNGGEYLKGGKLPTNTVEEENGVKVASIMGVSSGAYDFRTKTKKNNAYQNVRDYTITGMKGALTGLGVLSASNALRGRYGTPRGFMAVAKAKKRARLAAGVGAGLSVADRVYRHHDEHGKSKEAMVEQTPGTSFQTPATSLANARRTGSLKAGVVRHGGMPPRILQFGNKFRVR